MLISSASAPSVPEAPRRHRFTFTRLLLGVLITLALIFFVVLFGVAKSGIAHVPLLSNIVRQTVEPARVVTIPAGTPALPQLVEVQISGAAMRYARTPTEASRSFEIRLAEASLTKSLAAEAATALPQLFPGSELDSAQLLIEREWAELYLRLKEGKRMHSLRVRFRPVVRSGALTFAFTDVWIGSLPVSPAIAASMSKQALTDFSEKLRADLVTVAELEDVSLSKGTMVISGRFATGVLNRK